MLYTFITTFLHKVTFELTIPYNFKLMSIKIYKKYKNKSRTTEANLTKVCVFELLMKSIYIYSFQLNFSFKHLRAGLHLCGSYVLEVI